MSLQRIRTGTNRAREFLQFTLAVLGLDAAGQAVERPEVVVGFDGRNGVEPRLKAPVGVGRACRLRGGSCLLALLAMIIPLYNGSLARPIGAPVG